MKTMLICQDESDLSKVGIARWMASFSDLAGIIVIREKSGRFFKRIKNEVKRIGLLRFIDVVAYRVYYRLFLSRRDRVWREEMLAEICSDYPDLPETVSILFTDEPNSDRTRMFLEEKKPDLVLARCKSLLKEKIFSIPRHGIFVTHPGICPEYRNAHGCFWALANDDLDHVGMTLLKIDKGIDTGPVHEYFTYDYDEVKDSHIVIQEKMTLKNLDRLRIKFEEIAGGDRQTIDTKGRDSHLWGQPWLTRYLRWKWRARKRSR